MKRAVKSLASAESAPLGTLATAQRARRQRLRIETAARNLGI